VKLWVNGSATPADQPSLSALDRGFTLGDGLFETMRAQEGVVFRLDAHLDRLCTGARLLGIPLPPGLREQVADAARGDGEYRNASIRLTVSRGVAAPGLAPPERAEPTVTIVAHPVVRPRVPEPIVAIMAAGRRNEHALTAGVKTLAYTESIVALAQARAAGADDAIFLDTAGHVSEAAASNLFAVIDDVLVTPPLSCGVLPGITRAAVLELARALGITVVQREMAEPELAAASEIFLTSSIREIAPVVRVAKAAVGTGQHGQVTVRIVEAYRALVRLECAS
jgi:branched-chain amino acid aminotransferase